MSHTSDPTIVPARRDQRAGGSGEPRASKPQRDLVGLVWRSVSGWIRANTFAPSWLPIRLRHPAIGYLVAILLAAGAAGMNLLLVMNLPEFGLHGLFVILAAVLVALNWGGGPSLAATVFGAALLSYLLFPPLFTWSITSVDEAISLGLILVVGMLVSLMTGQASRARREAEKQAAALEEAKGHLDTFLGVASHELKTPLTGLKLSLQGLSRQVRRQRAELAPELTSSAEPLQLSLALAERQVERLERLVRDLLDVSHIQAGKLELRREVVNLLTLVREAVDVQRQATEDRPVTLQISTGEPVMVSGDPGRIEQVVTNYLLNALKYAPAGCPIEVGLQVESQQVRVWVHDEGPGVSAEEQERIWERFYRAKGITVQGGSGIGLGLGLYICRMIIEDHSGQVGIESTPGAGCTFWFTLPLVASSEPTEQAES